MPGTDWAGMPLLVWSLFKQFPASNFNLDVVRQLWIYFAGSQVRELIREVVGFAKKKTQQQPILKGHDDHLRPQISLDEPKKMEKTCGKMECRIMARDDEEFCDHYRAPSCLNSHHNNHHGPLIFSFSHQVVLIGTLF